MTERCRYNADGRCEYADTGMMALLWMPFEPVAIFLCARHCAIADAIKPSSLEELDIAVAVVDG